MRTVGRTTPHAIGIAALRLRRNMMRGEMPSFAASPRASGSQGASFTGSVRRAIHSTARCPAASRPRSAAAPAAQSANRMIGHGIGDSAARSPVVPGAGGTIAVSGAAAVREGGSIAAFNPPVTSGFSGTAAS
jgi:hypothetical protein